MNARSIFTIILTVIIPSLSYANYIDNPSMEGEFIYQDPATGVAEYWTGWREDYGYFQENNSYVHDGNKSQQIYWEGSGDQEFGPAGIYQQIDGLQAGQAYKVSIWSKFHFGSGFVEPGWAGGSITLSIGTDPNSGINPDVVTNWSSTYDNGWGESYDGYWINTVTFFSPNNTTSTLFIKADGDGEAYEEDPETGEMWSVSWGAQCYIDDANIEPIHVSQESSVSATTPVPANGASYSEVTITVVDTNEMPIVGIPPSEIDVNCSGSDNFVFGPDNHTDVNGQTTARIVSYTAEEKTISVTVLGTVLSDTAIVLFCESSMLKLHYSDGEAYDGFGDSVAIDGNAALVGAAGDDDNGSGSGSAYILHFDGENWVEKVKLLASDGESSDFFGSSVAIDGNAALVGAAGDDDNGSSSGSAYVFRFDGENWVEEAKLLAFDGALGDWFGESVSIDGNTVLVGAYGDDDNGSWSGSAYIFRFDGENWVKEAKLLASDGAEDDEFGYSVAIDGNTAWVGAYRDDDNGTNSGSAYIFRYDGENWVQEAKLIASDGEDYDNFGCSVAIDGNTALIGAYTGDVDGSNSGSAYIFRYNGSIWVEEAKLSASDGAAYDYFGYSVEIDGNVVLVGAWKNNGNGTGTNSGSVYFFRFDGSNWLQEAKLIAPDGAADDDFGISVAIDGNTILVGARDDDDNGKNSGSAYVFAVLSGDLDKDRDVDMFDFAILANQWLGEPSVPSADIAPCGGDCIVDFEDLIEFCKHWLEGTTP